MDKFIQAVLLANQGDSTWKSDDSNPLAKAKGLWEWKRADGKAQAKYLKGSMELWGTDFAEMQRKNFEQHFPRRILRPPAAPFAPDMGLYSPITHRSLKPSHR